MARTDAHAPYWAQGTLEPSHDHSDGVCNLPPMPRTHDAAKARQERHACDWWPAPYRTKWRQDNYTEVCAENKRRRTEAWLKIDVADQMAAAEAEAWERYMAPYIAEEKRRQVEMEIEATWLAHENGDDYEVWDYLAWHWNV